MRSRQVVEESIRREQAKPERAKQKRERVGDRSADGEVHAIKHTVHTSRKQEAAAAKEVAKPPRRRWQRPSTLPAMPDLPGYHVEYVRRDNRYRGDHANLSAHLRSGWDICLKSDYPAEHLPTVQIASHGEVIGNDDTVLMKIHEDLWAERQAYYEDARDAATRAINQRFPRLDVEHPDMPLFKDDTVNKHKAAFQRVAMKRAQRERAQRGGSVVAGDE